MFDGRLREYSCYTDSVSLRHCEEVESRQDEGWCIKLCIASRVKGGNMGGAKRTRSNVLRLFKSAGLMVPEPSFMSEI